MPHGILMTWMRCREVRERYHCFAKQLPFKLNFRTERLHCHHCTNCHCNATHIIPFLCTNWRVIELLQLYNTTHWRGSLVVFLGVLGIGSLLLSLVLSSFINEIISSSPACLRKNKKDVVWLVISKLRVTNYKATRRCNYPDTVHLS